MDITVPFVDLAWQYRSIQGKMHECLDEVGLSGSYILGSKLKDFEDSVSSYLGSRAAIGVGNGSDAITLTLRGLGIGVGDAVVTVPNSFIATAWAIRAVGATPTFVDVGEDFNLDPNLLLGSIDTQTRAVIPVHLAGTPADMNSICRIAEQVNIAIVEDCAQAIGASIAGKCVGTFGVAGSFSLHPLKNLGVLGDGGFITTSDPILERELRLLRNHGLEDRDHAVVWGFNSRLDDLQAAFAKVRLNRLSDWNSRVQEIADAYDHGLKDYVRIPVRHGERKSVHHNYMICHQNRERLRDHLYSYGVETKIHYPIPIHLQECARDLGYARGDFPVAERFSRETLSLPIHPGLTDRQVETVINAVTGFV